jgi:hypothetical protein
MVGSVAVAPPAIGHDYACQLCDLPAPYVGRTCLDWTQQLPALAHLLGRDDVPRKQHRLPRPLTPEQDQLIQRELLRRNDTSVMSCYSSGTPACASANVSISPWIVYAPWGPSSGPSMRRTSQGELRSVTVTPGGHRDSEH